MGFDVLYEDVDRRLSHHPPQDERTAQAHAAVRALTKAWMKAVADLLPASREKSLFATEGQQAMMWANAAIACEGVRQGITEEDIRVICESFDATYGDGSEVAPDGQGSSPL